MNPEIFSLIFFWFVRQIKSVLFWLYLWQLKEYRIDRFLVHFQTEKGRKIFLNFIFFFKIVLLFLLISSFYFLSFFFFLTYLLTLFYFSESLKSFLDFFLKKAKIPVFTKKILFLFLINISFFTFLLFLTLSFKPYLPILLLTFDIFSSLIVSLILLFFQPFVFIWKICLFNKAKQKREKFKDLIVVAIVGSYGKTSTKEFLAKILEKKFKVLKTEKNQNNEVSISKCILEKLNKDHQVFVCEIGAYRKGEIKRVVEIIKPKIGIVTGVNEQHLALFGSMENLISAEGGKELVERLPGDGILILNGENEILRNLYQNEKIEKKFIGLNNPHFDLFAKDILIKKEKIQFLALDKEGNFGKFELNLIGHQNIINILLAACAAKILSKMRLNEIALFSKEIKQEQSGVKLISTKYGFFIIDASYSTNPDAVLTHLEYLKVWEKKKVIVMPCLIELGRAGKEIHLKIGEKIREICDLAIITAFDYFRELKGNEKKIIFLEDSEKIIQKLREFLKEGDVVLFEGRVDKRIIEFFKENG
jgi:UDP-N-acetylmuramoyl-tripeptide--D-alanyl-D-alanine ligase